MPDGLRYYLMRDIVTGQDSDFRDERIIMSYNKSSRVVSATC